MVEMDGVESIGSELADVKAEADGTPPGDSPAASSNHSDTDPLSNGSDDTTPASSSRRKRRLPVKRGSSHDTKEGAYFAEEGDSKIFKNELGTEFISDLDDVKRDSSPTESYAEEEDKGDALSNAYSVATGRAAMPPGKKDFAMMDEARLRKQMINAQPRKTCPICGDKANGLHYGIYTCEGCKNFFKRSVLVCQERPYVCKYENSCSVSITEVRGVKMKSSRCQACRYQACIDAGMYHSGIQRPRGGRHFFSPSTAVAQVSMACGSSLLKSSRPVSGTCGSQPAPNKVASRYPQIQTPDIAAHLAAISQTSSSTEHRIWPSSKVRSSPKEAKDFYSFAESIIRKNMTSSSSPDQDDSPIQNLLESSTSRDTDCLSHCQAENASTEIELLKSRNRELSLSATEKDRQLQLRHKQIDRLNKALIESEKIIKEQSSLITSLKSALNVFWREGENRSTTFGSARRQNGEAHYLRRTGGSNNLLSSGPISGPIVFERGGVTITPVDRSVGEEASDAQFTEDNDGRMSGYHQDNDVDSVEMATIEPIIEVNYQDDDGDEDFARYHVGSESEDEKSHSIADSNDSNNATKWGQAQIVASEEHE